MKTTAAPQILSQVLHGRDPVLAAEAARLIGDWDLQALVPDLVQNLRTSRFYSKVSSIYSLDKLARAHLPNAQTAIEGQGAWGIPPVGSGDSSNNSQSPNTRDAC